jgi:membrane dipeptidase
MRRLLIGTLMAAAAWAAPRVVLVAGKPSHGPGAHEFNAGTLLLQKFLRQNGVEAEVVKGGWPQDEKVFEGARALVFYLDGGQRHPMLEGERLALLGKYTRKGVGIACLHYAVEVPAERGGAELLDWIGGYYERPYSQNPVNEVEVTQASPQHPISRGWKNFQARDEWYYRMRFRGGDQRVTPILTALLPKDAPNREVLAWAVERQDGGRGFGFTGGHFHANWGLPDFRRMIVNALLWVAKVEVPKGGARCDASAEELQQNLDDKPPPRRNPAAQLHRDALIFDAHVHVINRQFHHGGDIGERLEGGQFDLPRAREGGLDALFFTVFVNEQYYPARYETKHALRLVALAREQLEKNRAVIELALNAEDVDRIVASDKMAAVLDLEGGFDLDGDLAVLRSLYRLGLRSFQLPAHNWANHFADSCCAEQTIGGLNERGREVIREANRLGMVINVSHASDAAIEQALLVSKHPLVATHHGLRSFNNIPRTMPDDVLKKLAAKGGLIGFHIGNEFHNRPMFEWRTKQAGKAFWDTTEIARQDRMSIEEIDRRVAPEFPMVGMQAPADLLWTVDRWFDVVDRAIALVGEDHVVLGSDFDGGPTPPKGIRDVRDLPLLTEAMLRRGWSEARIRKFLGGNLLRVFREITGARP